ncbi:Kinesin-like protein bimC [Penicillium macrosclerotiorum]|uniref:Kinesin-like protein bimC n=1 Tax=Penicillium macrosclerotiorum TaxID=303699 RepID=UPI002547C5CC|nr:Kinesin-like protein bimC [Penicillium macrosclerotiorum]KAJ5698076.1 Kinesin-like protein bimC [Penicillium macrosclerotiorum]
MVGPARPSSAIPAAARRSGLRQPTRRAGSAVPDRQASPAVTMRPNTSSLARAPKQSPDQSNPSSIVKRKERDYEREINEDTSIHVVVRCRGRNEREIKENSGVVLSTEGVSGKNLDLSMGPNALSNKTYAFDKVFSPAADQILVFEEVVLPVLNEMLAGFNCTVFAYGQTGTGKTYTMSGDMTDTLGILSDDAGIIPRTLYSLFHKLEETDSTVKCSFIELYNEELRDLLSADDNTKLKIFESEKKGHASTLVQGMEESYIDSASTGIKLLQMGSHKRQVAATKCNDLSSRSHTIFTITVMTKRTTDSGEEYVSSGKLNLVDLAGSENIGRSGAENKRATEAGLINKSLLTLGRVINALVDKSSHIPYRESKLTRLLQDSLGGRTKTCIIATVSPAKSNLEETISTLDYAFRAKNIRNKPQINPLMSKNKLLRDIGMEIEKLRSELIATRHRNGVYMTPDAFEEMTTESESRRIVNEEQRAKIESMESSLRHKVQELFALTSNFNTLKQDNENTQSKLSNTREILEQREMDLKDTSEKLDEEKIVRQAHQDTENRLRKLGSDLLSTLDDTVEDVHGLHAKIGRQDKLESDNRQTWQSSTGEVINVTQQIDARVENFQTKHTELLENMSSRIHDFVDTELNTIRSTRSQLQQFSSAFDKIEAEAKKKTSSAHDEMNEVLEEIKVLREDVKTKVGEGLNGLSAAAARISKEVIGEFSEFHSQLHSSYSVLGKDFKSMFENMVSHLDQQKSEINKLRLELQEANRQSVEASRKASSNLAQTLEEEHASAQAERDNLMSQIRNLLDESNQRQSTRLKTKFETIRADISASGDALEQSTAQYDRHIDEWIFKEEQFAKDVTASRDEMKIKMQNDWEAFDQRNASIQRATESVHQETVRIVDAQMNDMSKQMGALDDFVAKARSHNGLFHEEQLSSLDALADNVRESRGVIHIQLDSLDGRVGQLQEDVTRHTGDLEQSTAPLQDEVRQPLNKLRATVQSHPMKDYVPTGATPQKRKYEYPTDLPRTESHDGLRSRHRTSRQFTALPFNEEAQAAPSPSSPVSSPSKGFVYSDAADEVGIHHIPSSTTTSSNNGLREVDLNVAKQLACDADEDSCKPETPAANLSLDLDETPERIEPEQPSLKRRRSGSSNTVEAKLPHKILSKKMAGMMEGRENMPPSAISGSRRYRNRAVE